MLLADSFLARVLVFIGKRELFLMPKVTWLENILTTRVAVLAIKEVWEFDKS